MQEICTQQLLSVFARSGELGLRAASSEVGNEVIHVKVEGVVEVTRGDDCEPMTSPLIDAGVGFMS